MKIDTSIRRKLRRITAVVLIIVLTFSLSSCGSSSKPTDQQSESGQVSSGSEDQKNAEVFRIEFEYNTDVAGDPPAAQDVTEGDLLAMPVVAPVSGYEFLGWVREERPAFPYDFSLPVTASFRLIGIWLDSSLDTTDTDEDGLSDALEELLHTDPAARDTDGDGLPDGMEVLQLRLDPLSKDTDGDGIPDGEEDTDEDGLSNLSELENGTNPMLSDSDTDGLSDGEEMNAWHTLPLDVDTDSDGVSDGVEVSIGSDPLRAENSFTTSMTGDEISEHHPVSIEVSAVTDAKGAGSLYIDELINTHIPALTPASYGYLAPAYELTTDGTLDHAVITFSYDSSLGEYRDDFKPTIYWYNEEESEFVEVPGQICVNGTVTAEVTHFSIYMLLDKAMMDLINDLIKDQIGRIAPDLIKDMNDDGLPDEVARLINEGYIKYDNTSLLEGVFDIYGEENDDWDGDGLKNGEEMELGFSLFGGIKLKIYSNPVLVDSDGDDISDYDESVLGTSPMRYDHRSVRALSSLRSDSKYLYAIHKEGLDDAIAKLIDFHKYDEAKDCLINYFYDYAPEESIEANAQAIAEYTEQCENIKWLSLVSNMASVYKSAYSAYQTDQKISEMEQPHYNEVYGDLTKMKKSWLEAVNYQQKAIDSKREDFEIDYLSLSTLPKKMSELQDAILKGDPYETSEKLTKAISALTKSLNNYQKYLTFVDFKFCDEFAVYNEAEKALKGSSLKPVSTVLTVTCDLLEGAEDIADLCMTYGKIRANFEAYNMYLELLLYVSDHAEDDYVKNAAGDLAEIILDNAAGEYERQLADACLKSAGETSVDIFLDLGSKTNSYIAIVKTFLDLYGETGVTNQSKHNIYFEVMTELSNGSKAILDDYVRLHEQTFSYDRDDEGEVLKYLTQLAQCRIVGEYYFYEYCADNSGAGWISSLFSGVPASRYMERFKNQVKSTYDDANRLQLRLSSNLPHFDDYWDNSVSEDKLMLKLDQKQALNKAAGIYVLSTGYGAWETRLLLEKDGTFSGYYHDTDTDWGTLENGEYYEAVMYFRNFTGRFSIGEMLGDYSCELILEDYSYEGTDGEESVENTWGRIKYVNSAAAGLEGWDRFVLYSPSMPAYEVPDHPWELFGKKQDFAIGFGDEDEIRSAFARIGDKKYSSYSTAYYQFVNYEQYYDDYWDYGTEEEVRYAVRDLDQDGTPELLITNGYANSSKQATYVYTYAYGELSHLSCFDDVPVDLYAVSNVAYPGVVGKVGDYWYYYWKNRDSLKFEIVAVEYPAHSFTQITSDGVLFDSVMASLMPGNRLFLD